MGRTSHQSHQRRRPEAHTEVGTHTHHHQPFASFVHGAVFIRCIGAGFVGVLGTLVDGQIVHVDRTGIVDLGLGAAANKHRLTKPFHGQLRTWLNAGCVNANRGERAHIGGGVHLIDQRPDGGTSSHGTCASGGVVEKVSPGAFVIFCVGHEVPPFFSRQAAHIGSGRSYPQPLSAAI